MYYVTILLHSSLLFTLSCLADFSLSSFDAFIGGENGGATGMLDGCEGSG